MLSFPWLALTSFLTSISSLSPLQLHGLPCSSSNSPTHLAPPQGLCIYCSFWLEFSSLGCQHDWLSHCLHVGSISEPATVGRWAQYNLDCHSFSYSWELGNVNFFLQIMYCPNKLCQEDGKIASLCVL